MLRIRFRMLRIRADLHFDDAFGGDARVVRGNEKALRLIQ
jgi:hypothetical protein